MLKQQCLQHQDWYHAAAVNLGLGGILKTTCVITGRGSQGTAGQARVLLKSAQREFLFSGGDGVAVLSVTKLSPALIKRDAAYFYISQGQKGFALERLELLPPLIADMNCWPAERFLVITDCAKD